jgi:phosphoglycolate phosphatase
MTAVTGTSPVQAWSKRFARERTGIPVHQIAVAGDNTHDLEMAENAGAGLKIGVLSGTGTAADLSPLADLILESCADLSDQVLVRP